MPSRAIAHILAQMGEKGDNEVGHLTRGEMVIPPNLQSPGLMSAIVREFDKMKVDWRKFQVGGIDDSRNKSTGMRQFGHEEGLGDADNAGPSGPAGGGGGRGADAYGPDPGRDFGGFSSPEPEEARQGEYSAAGADIDRPWEDPGRIDFSNVGGVMEQYAFTPEQLERMKPSSASYYSENPLSFLSKIIERPGQTFQDFFMGLTPGAIRGPPVTKNFPTFSINQPDPELEATRSFGIGAVSLAKDIAGRFIDLPLGAGIPLGAAAAFADRKLGSILDVANPSAIPETGIYSSPGSVDPSFGRPREDDESRPQPPQRGFQPRPPPPAAAQAPGEPAAPDAVGLPDFLSNLAGLSNIQQRSGIATGGISGPDPRYRGDVAKDYYKNLVLRTLTDIPLPIEQQYLREVFGRDPGGTTESFLSALGG